jgi:hypothetical protein
MTNASDVASNTEKQKGAAPALDICLLITTDALRLAAQLFNTLRSHLRRNAEFHVFDDGHNYCQVSEITKSASARIESHAPESMFD